MPSPVTELAARIGVRFRNIAILEQAIVHSSWVNEHSDTRTGVLAAKAAGMTVAVVPNLASSEEDLSPADLVIPSLEALPKVLERNGNGNGNGNGHSH